MQHFININSLNKNVNITSNLNIFKNSKHSLIKVLIPGADFNFNDNEEYDFQIKHIQNEQIQSVSIIDNIITVNDDWSNGIPGYIYFFLFKVFDYIMLKNNVISFHASSVNINNKNILILGNPGDGKTSTMMNLISNHNAKYNSNNRVYVSFDSQNKPCILSGTNFITIRPQDITRYNYKNINIPEVKHSINPEVTISAEDIAEINNETLKKLDYIYIANITPNCDEFLKLSFDDALIKTHENISKTLWGECLLFNGKQPSPIKTTLEEDQLKLNNLRNILEKTSVYFVKGDMDFICQNILNTSK